MRRGAWKIPFNQDPPIELAAYEAAYSTSRAPYRNLSNAY
jgi:hypothetical protein